MRLSLRSLIAVASLGVATLAFPMPAHAAEPPKPDHAAPAAPAAAGSNVEILVLHATNGDKGIDPRIGNMPELAQAPFSSYKSYALLRKVRLPLKVGEAK